MKIEIDNGLRFSLDEKDYTASIINSPEVTGDVIVPRLVEHQGKQFIIKSIGVKAFSENRIKSLSFPEDSEVESIKGYAFLKAHIRKIQFPASLKNLDDFWCQNVYDLISIEVSPKNKFFLFIDNSYLVGKSQENSDVYDILYYARYDIKNAIIPPQIKRLKTNSFRSHNLFSISFPENSKLKVIEDFAFSGSTIRKLSIPAELTEIDGKNFDSVDKLIDISVSTKNNLFYYSDNQYLLKKSQPESINYDILVFCRRDITKAVIPSYIKEISGNAFNCCTKLTNLSFEPNSSLTTISYSAFCFCYGLKMIVFPESIQKVGNNAFSFIGSLKFVRFLGKSVVIGRSCFSSCRSLSAISFPHANQIIFSDKSFSDVPDEMVIRVSSKANLLGTGIDDCMKYIKYYEDNKRENEEDDADNDGSTIDAIERSTPPLLQRDEQDQQEEIFGDFVEVDDESSYEDDDDNDYLAHKTDTNMQVGNDNKNDLNNNEKEDNINGNIDERDTLNNNNEECTFEEEEEEDTLNNNNKEEDTLNNNENTLNNNNKEEDTLNNNENTLNNNNKEEDTLNNNENTLNNNNKEEDTLNNNENTLNNNNEECTFEEEEEDTLNNNKEEDTLNNNENTLYNEEEDILNNNENTLNNDKKEDTLYNEEANTLNNNENTLNNNENTLNNNENTLNNNEEEGTLDNKDEDKLTRDDNEKESKPEENENDLKDDRTHEYEVDNIKTENNEGNDRDPYSNSDASLFIQERSVNLSADLSSDHHDSDELINNLIASRDAEKLMEYLHHHCDNEKISEIFDRFYYESPDFYNDLCRAGITLNNAVSHHKYAIHLIFKENNFSIAKHHLLKAIQLGYNKSYFSLASLYHKCFHEDQSAASIAIEGSQKGDNYSKGLLGHFISRGIGIKKDYRKGIQIMLESGADDYYQRYATEIGLYFIILGDEKKVKSKPFEGNQEELFNENLFEYKEAFKWFEVAFQMIVSKTTVNNLGICFLKGIGVPKNIEKAKEIFEIGIQNNDPNSMYHMGFILENTNSEQSFKFYKEAAYKGHHHAQYHYACLMNDKDHEESAKFFKLAGDHLKPNSQGLFDENLPNEFFLKEDEINENKEPQPAVSMKYSNENDSEITQKLPPQNSIVSIEYAIQLFNQKHFEEAFNYFSLISEINNPAAMYFVGVMLFNGLGCEKNREKSYDILKKLSNDGIDKATEFIKKHF